YNTAELLVEPLTLPDMKTLATLMPGFREPQGAGEQQLTGAYRTDLTGRIQKQGDANAANLLGKIKEVYAGRGPNSTGMAAATQAALDKYNANGQLPRITDMVKVALAKDTKLWDTPFGKLVPAVTAAALGVILTVLTNGGETQPLNATPGAQA